MSDEVDAVAMLAHGRSDAVCLGGRNVMASVHKEQGVHARVHPRSHRSKTAIGLVEKNVKRCGQRAVSRPRPVESRGRYVHECRAGAVDKLVSSHAHEPDRRFPQNADAPGTDHFTRSGQNARGSGTIMLRDATFGSRTAP